MRNKSYKSKMVILVIIIPILFSCATIQQKQGESRDAQFYNNQGAIYVAKGQYDQAISDFNKVLEIDPKFAGGGAYYGRAMVYEKKNQYDQAILDFNKALEIDPKHASAYYNRGRSYYFKKEYDKSWNDIRKAQDLGYKIPAEFLDDLRKASEREE